MGVLGAMVRTTQTYPALLPLIILTVIIAIWARRKHRFVLMGASILLAALFVFFYTGQRPVAAMEPPDRSEFPAVEGGTTVAEVHAASSLHYRFPDDFPVPTFFHHEHTRGEKHHGALTVRFRFRGSPADAVRDLAEAGAMHGWTVEQFAPHRLVFTKGNRTVEAWFSFPGLSLVLDVPDPR